MPKKIRRTPMQKRVRNYYKGGRQLYRDIGLVTGYNTEKKYNDATGWSSAVITQSSPNVSLLNALQLGLTATTRNGISVKLTRIEANLKFQVNTAVPTQCLIKYALVWQKAVNGTIITYNGSDINSLYTAVGTTTMRNIYGEDNLKILKQGVLALDPDSYGVRYLHISKRLNKHTHFNAGTAGDVTDITAGALYLVFDSSENTNPPNLTGASRIRYVDN